MTLDSLSKAGGAPVDFLVARAFMNPEAKLAEIGTALLKFVPGVTAHQVTWDVDSLAPSNSIEKIVEPFAVRRKAAEVDFARAEVAELSDQLLAARRRLQVAKAVAEIPEGEPASNSKRLRQE